MLFLVPPCAIDKYTFPKQWQNEIHTPFYRRHKVSCNVIFNLRALSTTDWLGFWLWVVLNYNKSY